jgi:hypothetical protein
MKSFGLWFLTFLGFPLGGLIAIQVVGTIESPLTGALAGLIAGAAIGGAQWLVLRSNGVAVVWVPLTAIAMAAGTALASEILESGTATRELALQGLIAGGFVGVTQGALLMRIRGPIATAWAVTVPVTWALGWTITSSIGVDVERGYAVFGSSGAVTVTIISGLVLHLIFRGAPASGSAPTCSVEAAAR